MTISIRHFKRVPTQLPASLICADGRTFGVEIANMSSAGLLIHCDLNTLKGIHPSPSLLQFKNTVDVDIYFTLALPGKPQEIRSHCKVVYARRLSHQVFQLGLEFLTFQEGSQDTVDTFIGHNRPGPTKPSE